MSDLVGNPEDRFSQNEAHFVVCFLGALWVYDYVLTWSIKIKDQQSKDMSKQCKHRRPENIHNIFQNIKTNISNRSTKVILINVPFFNKQPLFNKAISLGMNLKSSILYP